MQYKKLLIGLVIVLILALPQSGTSLGMGELEVFSALDEQLEAYIELRIDERETLDGLQVGLASAEDYRKVGLDKSFVPSNIQVSMDEDNSQLIRLTSVGPVSEPIVSILLDINWSNGRLLREYTLLLDPPVYAESTGSSVSNEVVEITPVQTQQPQVEASEEDNYFDNSSFQTVDTSPSVGEVDVQSGDTLWSIASRNKPSGVSTQQMMMAIYYANPNAFLNNNINQLVKGTRLRIPGADEVDAVSFSDAVSQVRQHNQSWSPSTQYASSYQTTNASSSSSDSGASSSLDYGVELVGNDDSETYAGNDSGDFQDLQNRIIRLQEELTNKSSKNDELQSRVSELEDLVEQQRIALELKDSDMASLQNQMSEASNMGDDNGSAMDQVSDAVDEYASDVTDTADDVWDTTVNAVDDATDAMTDDTTDSVYDDAGDESVSLGDLVDEDNTVAEDDAASMEQTDDANSAQQNNADNTVPRFQPKEESSFFDKALHWVQNNMLYTGLGVLGLLLLLFLPKLLGRRDDGFDEADFLDELHTLDDDTTQSDDFDLGPDDAVTKMTSPLDEDEDDEAQDDEADDPLAELDRQIDRQSMDIDDDELEDLQDVAEAAEDSEDELFDLSDDDAVEDDDDEDAFELDDFLNDDDDEEDDLEMALDTNAEADADDDAEDADDLDDDFDLDESLSLDDDDALEDEVPAEPSDEKDDASEDDFLDDDLDFDLDEFDEELSLDLDDDTPAKAADEADDDLDVALEIENDLVETDMSEDSEHDDISLELEDDNNEEIDFDDESEASDEPVDIGMELDDLLEDEDSVGTKLDLAKAYIEMGDHSGAANMLDEVIEEGNAEQVEKAKQMKKDIDS